MSDGAHLAHVCIFASQGALLSVYLLDGMMATIDLGGSSHVPPYEVHFEL